MLTFLFVVAGAVAVVAVTVKVFGKDKVEAKVKAVEEKVVDEVKKL